MTVTQTKPQFLTEALIEVLNNQWKVDALESSRSVYTQLEIETGRKYIKVWSYLVNGCFGLNERVRGRSIWMFIDKNDGACYKPASCQRTCKRCPFLITQLADNPHICDAYGSFPVSLIMFSDTNRQLRKLSIYKPMQFRVTKINFDFEDDNFELSPIEQQEVIEETLSYNMGSI